MLFTVGSACSLSCIRSLLGNTRGKSAKRCSSQSAVDAHITSQHGRLASTSPTMPYGTGKQSNSYMAVFFFLVCHPSDEETPWGQPAPCGQTAPWSHPYSSQCGQSAPLVLNSYMAVFFFLVCHPSDEETPWGQPAPCGQTAPWSHPYTHPNVASQHPWC